jgi:hypothetical protein
MHPTNKLGPKKGKVLVKIQDTGKEEIKKKKIQCLRFYLA